MIAIGSLSELANYSLTVRFRINSSVTIISSSKFAEVVRWRKYLFASEVKIGACAAANASLGAHSASGFAHLLSDEQNPVTHFGVQPLASKSAPSHEDVAHQRWVAAYGIGMP